LDSGQKKLEEAIRLDPNLPAAPGKHGAPVVRQDKRYEAERYFFARCCTGFKERPGLLLPRDAPDVPGADAEEIAEAKTALEKAVALNPGLGWAWSNLGLLYANDAGALDKALSAAKRAVDIVPGEPHFQYNLAKFLLAMERFDEAADHRPETSKFRRLKHRFSCREISDANDQAQQYAAYKKMNEATSATAPAINRETN